jgi:uncharacterized protein (TIGR03032 family)
VTERERLHEAQNEEWRDPATVVAQWADAGAVDPLLLRARVRGDWWETLERLDVTLLVSREYEHLLLGLTVVDGPRVTYLRLPHPSGIAADLDRGLVHVAATRNPNQVFDLAPARGAETRLDAEPPDVADHPLVPVRSRFYPGSLYLHDLAVVGGRLHGNAVGQNAVVRLPDAGGYERVWWPKAIETASGPEFRRNHLQLNSIAAGRDLRSSFFSASTDELGRLRPGHQRFPVDGRGVVFSGRTREPIVRGLTRPHSARLHGGRVWLDDSGYGRFGVVSNGSFEPVASLPGWTRGLCFAHEVAFVGTSRVLPRFRQYAPGLDLDRSVCGVHAVDGTTGKVLGSMVWPEGNQIFSIEQVPRRFSRGFPFAARGSRARATRLFYAFATGERR